MKYAKFAVYLFFACAVMAEPVITGRGPSGGVFTDKQIEIGKFSPGSAVLVLRIREHTPGTETVPHVVRHLDRWGGANGETARNLLAVLDEMSVYIRTPPQVRSKLGYRTSEFFGGLDLGVILENDEPVVLLYVHGTRTASGARVHPATAYSNNPIRLTVESFDRLHERVRSLQPPPPEPRPTPTRPLRWVSSAGHEIEATLVHASARAVTLRATDGRMITVEPQQLSEDCQRFLRIIGDYP